MIKDVKEVTSLVAHVNHHHEFSTIGMVGAEVAMRLGESVLHGLTSSLLAIYLFVGFIQGLVGWKSLRKTVKDHPTLNVTSKYKMAGVSTFMICITAVCWGIFLVKDFMFETFVEGEV